MNVVERIKALSTLKHELEESFAFPVTVEFGQGMLGPNSFVASFKETITKVEDGKTWKEKVSADLIRWNGTANGTPTSVVFGSLDDIEEFKGVVASLLVLQCGALYTLVNPKEGGEKC